VEEIPKDIPKTDRRRWEMYQFVGLMIARLYQKYDEGWQGWESIETEDYVRRATKNLEKGDYVDAANLCMLAYYARSTYLKEGSYEEG